jgi:hypothetical protein
MKLFINHLDKENFLSKVSHLKDIDFSLFIDYFPQSQNELSEINIISFQEPNEYFGTHDAVIQNKNLFNAILTWNDKVLNHCDNAMFMPFGSTWLKPEQYEKDYPKYFQVSHVRGNLLKTHGHSLRFEYHNRSQTELKMPYKSWETAGIREKIETCAAAKCELFGDAQFGVAIENTSYRGYFTEKIMELFLFKTIPIYWGCSNIGDFFNKDGIISVNNIDDAIYALNNLDENYYSSKIDAVNENYKLALQYIDYEQNIVNKITEIFELNNFL